MTDPAYLNPSASNYIGHQISQFALGTPLEGFLLKFAVPNASLFGVLVMGGEFCIGIAVLLGLLTRFSAAMGLLLNLTFFLSATWDVHPFYFGADLPYAFAWLTLLLAGPGPYALDARLKEWLSPPPIITTSRGRTITVEDKDAAMTRRAILGAGAAGLTAVMLAASGLGWGILNSEKRSGSVATVPASGSPTQPPISAATLVPEATPKTGGSGGADTSVPAQPSVPTSAPPSEPTATSGAGLSGLTKVADANEVPVNQSLDFVLPTGDPAVLVHNDSGYSAYVAICTHAGCQVSYFPQYKIIGCPCHGAEFDAANGGRVLRGPARRPLHSVALTVGPDGGVYLAG